MATDTPDGDDRSGQGQVDSDDTTQADAGMVGGTGTEEQGASVTPQATEPHADDEDTED